jgi:hypothetical protein
MEFGRGSRLTFGNFTVSVEAHGEGWIAVIRDRGVGPWHWEGNVASEEEGRSVAMIKLIAHLSAAQRLALAADKPQWESYKQNKDKD